MFQLKTSLNYQQQKVLHNEDLSWMIISFSVIKSYLRFSADYCHLLSDHLSRDVVLKCRGVD